MSAPDDGFRREARAQCRALTNGLIELERGEADVAELFRVSHSLKGACRSVGLSGAGDIAHAVETLFEAVRAGRLDPDAALVDEAIDAIAVLEAAVDGEADEDPAAVAAALVERIDAQRDETATSDRAQSPASGPDDTHGDVDDDVAAALDAASEFDDIDALLDEADDEPTDDAVDGWGMLGDDEPAQVGPAEGTAEPGAEPEPAEATDHDAEPDPAAVPDDPSAYFEQAKQEGSTEETTTDDLQAEIESVSFGEFDEDDDVSIEELLAMEPDDEAPAKEPVPEASVDEEAPAEPAEPATEASAAGEATPDAPPSTPTESDPADAAEPATPTGAAADANSDAEDADVATAADDAPTDEPVEPAVVEAEDAEPEPEPEPAVTPVEDAEPATAEDVEPEPAITAVDDPPTEPVDTEAAEPDPEPAVTEIDEPVPDDDGSDEDLRAIVERLAEPVDEPATADAEPTTEEPAEPEPEPAATEPDEPVDADDAAEPASASGPTIDPEDGLFDGVTLPGTDEEAEPADAEPAEPSADDPAAEEPAPSGADASETEASAPTDALDDVTLPGTDAAAPADSADDDGVTLPETGTASPADDDLDDLSDVELPDSDAPMDVRMDETLVEFEGDVAGLLDVDASEVSMPGTAALTIEESTLDGDRFRPLGAGATPATVETDQEPLTVAPDNAERLLNLAEELSLVEMRLGAAVGDAPDGPLAEALAQLSSLVGEYQRTVMDVRLTPLASAVERLPAVARDAARAADKQVRVETEGTDVRLDRSVVERLGDPLGHLVRNAVAHGIESPADRKAAGKPETGTVTVSAERVRDEVVVEVHDDGAGVDIDSVRERAVEAGIVDADTAAALDADAVLDMLFESGLSTADEVTEVAGRGVGLDAVAGAVRRVDGDVAVETTPGQGTTVRLTLPVSVALTEVMLVRAGGQRFAVPLSAIEQVSPLPEPRVADGRETVRRADLAWGSDPAGDADVERPYPLVRLSEAFDLAGDDAQLLWLRPEAGDAALGVGEVIGTREVVVRPYGEVFGPSAAVSGAATVGDGETVNVLDPASLAGGA